MFWIAAIFPNATVKVCTEKCWGSLHDPACVLCDGKLLDSYRSGVDRMSSDILENMIARLLLQYPNLVAVQLYNDGNCLSTWRA